MQSINYEKGSLFQIAKYDKNLYVGFGNSQIGLIDAQTLKLKNSYKGHKYLIYSLYIDRSKDLLYSGSDDETVKIWKIQKDGTLHYLETLKEIKGAVKGITKKGNLLILIRADGKLILYDTDTKQELFSCQNKSISVVSFLQYQNKLFLGDSSGNVFVYKILTKSLNLIDSFTMQGSVRSINTLGNSVVIVSKEGQIKLYK